VLTSVGPYANEASVCATPAGPEGECKPSNKVIIEVPGEPAFTIEKLQEIAGSGSGFTAGTLTGQVGQRVNYVIVVKNTGNEPLTFSNFTDSKCDPGTITGGPSKALAPGESATYTCDHVLTSADQSAGRYENTAVDTGTPPEGAPVTHPSNTVVVNVPAAVVLPFTATVPALKGPEGCARPGFAASIKAAGVKSVTFYLDGHKVRTLTSRDARGGRLTINVRSNGLRVGTHRLTAKIVMSGAAKPATATRTIMFVVCGSAAVKPHFTG
jgi:hypothetical protein